MKIGIIYAPQPRHLEQTARNLGRTLEKKGHQVEYLAMGSQDRSASLRKYDFLYLGSVAEGFLGGKIPDTVKDYVKQCRGLENSKSAAFLLKRLFGNTKGMKRLMAVLESMGSQVLDFQVIGGNSDIEALADRLRG
jgi:flavodoxin